MSTWLYSDDLQAPIQDLSDLSEAEITDLEASLGFRFNRVVIGCGEPVSRPSAEANPPTYLQAWLFARRELGMSPGDFDKLVSTGLIRADQEVK